ncbi:hypothetical protein CLV91_2054 [Maribacter vaceletii]|uniref:LTXXQ motif family protein n=1 Tax=Maribacter vaceletii TaxID=1206816 RepID=A0A495EBR6_9FLAO|nr:hypothetical protein [Maribacter vaceletii]RKR13337.1 hypothetical protein CLV91_2054 [Maribacter vaceletii]
MKINIKCFLAFAVLFLLGSELHAQYGYGGGGYGYGNRGGYGRQRNNLPQVESTPKKEEPKTAAQIVDNEMPNITEALNLNEFETAVLSSVLKKYLQQRIEMRILELSPEQMREGLEKITKNQDKELKAGLPQDKYDAFVEMQKKGIAKTKKLNKKKKKKKRKKD